MVVPPKSTTVGDPRTSWQSPWGVWALAIFVVVILTGYLGDYGLLEDSEGRYSEISAEMVDGGDWVTPHLNFIRHFHNRPLPTGWLVSVFESSARLSSPPGFR